MATTSSVKVREWGFEVTRVFEYKIIDGVLSVEDIDYLPEIPKGIAGLKIYSSYGGSALTSLPTLPDGLKCLECMHIGLTSLPKLPDSLVRLDVTGTKITNLPDLPKGLVELEFAGCPLESLPVLPDSLTTLSCCNNKLRSLPELPKGLTGLYIYNCDITSLPDLPTGLKIIYLTNTKIQAIHQLPQGLETLEIRNNKDLTAFPILPDSLRKFYCHDRNNVPLPEIPNDCQVFTEGFIGLYGRDIR